MDHQIVINKPFAKDPVLRIVSLFILMGVVISGVFYFLAGIDFSVSLSHITFCPFKVIIGLPCPGCGMTRAFISLGQLNIVKAMTFNPFSIILFWIILFYAMKGRLPVILFNKTFIKLLLGLLIVFWIFRISIIKI